MLVETVGFILKESETVSRAKINLNKSVKLRFGTWRGRSMSTNDIMG